MTSLVPIDQEVSAIRRRVAQWREAGLRIALVPTMGYLHQGHLSLIHHALTLAQRVIVSIYVNPTQFGPNEDLDRYPRDPEGDRDKVSRAGAHLIFQPSSDTMYPQGAQTFVETTAISVPLCGGDRPGHFRGVTTVVAKLFHIVKPDVAVFGQKDYQQLLTIQRMVTDLHMEVEVVGAPLVREDDGLALSSRNVYLSPTQRKEALRLSQALRRIREAFHTGERDPHNLLATGRAVLASPALQLEYLEIRNKHTLQLVDQKVSAEDRIFLAARLGATRLIDNAPLGLPASLDNLHQEMH